jgi:hypothetical protein
MNGPHSELSLTLTDKGNGIDDRATCQETKEMESMTGPTAFSFRWLRHDTQASSIDPRSVSQPAWR